MLHDTSIPPETPSVEVEPPVAFSDSKDPLTQTIIQLYQEGHSHREIARRAKTSRATVGRRIRASGIKRRNISRKKKLMDPERAWELYETGYTLREVGELMGVNYETVRLELRAHGYTLRPKGRPSGEVYAHTRDLLRWLTLLGQPDGIEMVEEEILAKLEGGAG